LVIREDLSKIEGHVSNAFRSFIRYYGLWRMSDCKNLSCLSFRTF
jgi:hypothetical protein